ncbi:MAG: methyltransferase domain-containing protein [Candidatus Brocadiae bacterium]|nr:methyltransferase domain-containing protein [Candidatus Brocadiia bacterium]
MKTQWIDLFNEIAEDRKHIHLHQMSGWKDIEDIALWEDYVADVIQGQIQPKDRIFEAGCGCGCFLLTIKKFYPDITVAGIDAAVSAIQRIQKEILPEKEARYFKVGILPDGLNQEPSASYNIVLSNSVFQYIQKKEDAEKSVQEMIRITKPGGKIIIADVVDEAFRSINEEKMRALWDGYGEEQGYPCHAYYAKEWWNRFQTEGNSLFIRHVDVEKYWRRKYRYVVYIDKQIA